MIMNDINKSPSYRYPGAIPFSTDQRNLFFGRDQDIQELMELIEHDPIVVLYGKSGLGKSSLINAGIIPALEQPGTRQPIVIRFGAWSELKEGFVLDSTKNIIRNHYKSEGFLGKIVERDNSLWYYLKNWQLEHRSKPLLIFDQFEEFFTYPETEIENFKVELAEALQVKLPLEYHRKLAELPDGVLSEEEEDLLEVAIDPHILFSVRSDKLHLLERITTHLPYALRTCYELSALNAEDAKKAIVEPASFKGDFVSPTFEYSDAALANLLNFLQDKREGTVEGILIQMLCENYEKKMVVQQGLRFLDVHNIGDPSSVIRNYYIGKINLLPEEKRLSARQLIEEGLISAEGQLRLSLHQFFILREYDVDVDLLNKLVDNHLLRAEVFLRGGYNYEVSHDRLVPAILELYEARKNEEEETKRKKEALRIKQEAEEVRKKKIQVNRQSRINVALLAAVILVSICAAFLVQQNNSRKKEAEEAVDNLREKTEELAEATDRLHTLQAQTFNNIEEELNGIRVLAPNIALPQERMEIMESIARSHPDSSEMLKRIEKLRIN